MKVFISHSSQDYELAKTLKNILKKSKLVKEVFVYEDKKKLGTQISKKITDEINSSDYLIALITKNSMESASVNQEYGYAQAKNLQKIPFLEEGSEEGILIYGTEKINFSRENFSEKCLEVKEYLLDNGLPDKVSGEEVFLIQKSAHFRYEIKQHLDEILDSVIYRLQVVPEKRDCLFENNKKRQILFKDIFEVFDHHFPNFKVKQIPPIENQLLKFPLNTFDRFNSDFEMFRNDINETKELTHNDLLPDELDAFQKLNKAICDVEENSFDIKNYTKKYYDDEQALSDCDNFLQIMEKYPKDASIPLTSIFRGKMRDLSTVVKSIILLEQEIDKIYDKFGKISLKDRYIE